MGCGKREMAAIVSDAVDAASASAMFGSQTVSDATRQRLRTSSQSLVVAFAHMKPGSTATRSESSLAESVRPSENRGATTTTASTTTATTTTKGAISAFPSGDFVFRRTLSLTRTHAHTHTHTHAQMHA
ncbi:hypothetical protein K431DRAFT_106364 [Polychaeton citri CBS 116435]|uniref:Uncharacterized protein n=1 Tax=Polychaeton citri CBS 116435 TaxID=1314669 RepID=A0A9P4Q385_9PEZI|nr:hypothetical protein K431DRAFT_106364 [Polychaeton citri CBS 116435]